MDKVRQTKTLADRRPLVRLIVGSYPDAGIFTKVAKNMPPLGLVNVATSISEYPKKEYSDFRVEIIDENNYCGPRDENGLPDHKMLQLENPAQVVGFYTGLTSTVDRAYELSRFYSSRGAFLIAGGWHAHYLPEEALANGFDIVVHGDGEIVINQILAAWKNNKPFSSIPGISFRESGRVKTNLIKGQKPTELPFLKVPDLNAISYPNFNLLKYAGEIKLYPISWIRGCRWKCEFCLVKGKPRWPRAMYIFGLIKHLVKTRGARAFFLVDDRLEEELAREELLFLLKLIGDEFGDNLAFTIQIRAKTAEDTVLLKAMKRAGVVNVCVGLESPIDEDLKAMHKGFTVKQMIEWVKILRRYFWVHGMFIFGYPSEEKSALTAKEMIERYKDFIRKTKISSIQILHPVPIPGSDLWKRLSLDGRIFPLNVVPWSRYDGGSACFIPDNMSLADFQEGPFKLMKWFYSGASFWTIPLRTISFPFEYLVTGWERWHHAWAREIVKYGGHLLMQKWRAYRESELFTKKLEEHMNMKSGK